VLNKILFLALIIAGLNGCAGVDYSLRRDTRPIFNFTLAMPEKNSDIDYLGLDKNSRSFKLSQIDSPAVLIEVFSMYCIYCQQAAGQVNELYRLIEKNGLADKIKVIGIGTGNSHQEAGIFKDKFAVPFPLFPDFREGVSIVLNAKSTPTFVLLSTRGNRIRSICRYEGKFFNAEQFLGEVRKAMAKEGL
jgi:thioredoxin-related protein